MNTKTNRLWVSDKVRELFQFPPDRPITYAEFEDRVHPDHRAARDSAIKHAVETQGHYESEYRVVLPDGTIRWIAGRGRCVDDGNDGSCRLLGVSMDITSRKLAEEEAHQRREQLDLLGRAGLLGEMTASLAHELNQPLSAIVNNATAGRQFISGGKVDPKELSEIFDDVIADGRRAHDIVQNLRNAIKGGSAIRGRISLNDVITTVAHLMHPEAVARSCRVDLDLTSQLPRVEGDPIQIQQVLINLVRNAFEAMQAMPMSARVVQISSSPSDTETVCVRVRDFGPGVPEAAREQIFEKFFTTRKEGLGMGLAITRSIVGSHGGTITVANAEGGGAQFFVQLPISKGNGERDDG